MESLDVSRVSDSDQSHWSRLGRGLVDTDDLANVFVLQIRKKIIQKIFAYKIAWSLEQTGNRVLVLRGARKES